MAMSTVLTPADSKYVSVFSPDDQNRCVLCCAVCYDLLLQVRCAGGCQRGAKKGKRSSSSTVGSGSSTGDEEQGSKVLRSVICCHQLADMCQPGGGGKGEGSSTV